MRSSELLALLTGFQKVNDCGQRFRLRIDCLSQDPILAKFCEALRFDRFEFASEHGSRVSTYVKRHIGTS